MPLYEFYGTIKNRCIPKIIFISKSWYEVGTFRIRHISSNEEVIYMDYRKVMNPSASGYNYWNINFLDFEKVAEIQDPIKKIIKILYSHNFLNSDGTVSEKAVKKICLKYGKKYSWP